MKGLFLAVLLGCFFTKTGSVTAKSSSMTSSVKTGLSLNSQSYFKSGHLFSLRKSEAGLHQHRLKEFLNELNDNPYLIEGMRHRVSDKEGIGRVNFFNKMLKINKLVDSTNSAYELADKLYQESQGITIADHYKKLKSIGVKLNSVSSPRDPPPDLIDEISKVELKQFDLLLKIIPIIHSVNSAEELADKLYIDIINGSYSLAYRKEHPTLGLDRLVEVSAKYPLLYDKQKGRYYDPNIQEGLN